MTSIAGGGRLRRDLPARLSNAVTSIAPDLHTILSRRHASWKQQTERTLWRSLVSTILGSQVRHEQMLAALDRIDGAGLGEPWTLKASPAELAREYRWALTTPAMKQPRFRFPERASRQLTMAVCAVYVDSNGFRQSIRLLLNRLVSAAEAREEVARLIPGVGRKQASLFLIDVGFSDNMAAIDRHIAGYLALQTADHLELGNQYLVSALPRRYEDYVRVEERLRLGADAIGVSLSAYDLAIWTVMRVWSRLRRAPTPTHSNRDL